MEIFTYNQNVMIICQLKDLKNPNKSNKAKINPQHIKV